MLTVSQLTLIIKQDGEHQEKAAARASEWITPLIKAMMKYGINTPARQAAFLAQIGLESAGLTRLSENLNYSAQGLANTWPSRYLDKVTKKPNALALRLNRNPQAIANNAYASRMGNGDEASGDGWKFRGRSPKQVTGKANYIACGKALGIDLVSNPDLLLKPEWGAMAAAWFWHSNNLNAFADKGDFLSITKRINGGTIGHDDNDRQDKDTRVDYWEVAKKVLGA